MNSVSVFDAKNRLSALLDQVERGETITITRRGQPIAQLVPLRSDAKITAAVEGLRKLRQELAERGETFDWEEWKAFRDEGRR
jgi:prevent-host-death family protein